MVELVDQALQIAALDQRDGGLAHGPAAQGHDGAIEGLVLLALDAVAQGVDRCGPAPTGVGQGVAPLDHVDEERLGHRRRPACGDVMKLQIRVEDGVITDARFKTYGCGSVIASSSLVTEWVKGMRVDQALEINNGQIAEELSLPPVKIHCSVLAEDAIKAAIRDWQAKQAQLEAQAQGTAAAEAHSS